MTNPSQPASLTSMKRPTWAGLMILSVLSLANLAASYGKAAAPSIQDPILQEAWTGLYNLQDPIRLWDGRTLTGRELAQFQRDQAIPIVWDTENVCRAGSCSILYCHLETCTYDDGQQTVAPIYIPPTERSAMSNLIDTLAHEIFHRTQPFGAVRDTRFEEYWAFFVGAKIAGSAWPEFGVYDPLDPDQLNLWFRENRMEYYFRLPEYPASVMPLVHRTAGGADPIEGVLAAIQPFK